MEFQSPPKSVWSTFKNAYLRKRNLRSFWNKLDKKNLSQELMNTMNCFLLSESYNWTSKFWRHLIIKHLKFLSDKSASNNYQNTISQEYAGFTYINEALIKESCEKIKENKIELNINLFKKHDEFSITESINYNLLVLILYENIKSKDVFKLKSMLSPIEYFDLERKPLVCLSYVLLLKYIHWGLVMKIIRGATS